jgi:hypothetical protein
VSQCWLTKDNGTIEGQHRVTDPDELLWGINSTKPDKGASGFVVRLLFFGTDFCRDAG